MSHESNLRRQATRAAIRIHEHLQGAACRAQVSALPSGRWVELGRVFARFEVTQRQGWQAAGATLVCDLDYQLRRLVMELESVRSGLPQPRAQGPVSPAGIIAADLLALSDEFESVSIDLNEKVLRVDTAGIVLEDLDFGPFQIVLHWERIGQARAYQVQATRPNCPHGRSDVTHPHVEHHTLCEGTGASAIRNALSNGRLLDFFLLVRQVLETYNGGSAYVALDDWSEGHRLSCQDCGYDMSSDDSSSCERCGTSICDDCSGSCGNCGRSTCSECRTTCANCADSFCYACLSTEPLTGRMLCQTCLKDEDDSAHESNPIDDDSAPAADAICLGEAAATA